MRCILTWTVPHIYQIANPAHKGSITKFIPCTFTTSTIMPGRGNGNDRRNNSSWTKGSNQKRPRDMGRGQWARAQKEERLARGDKKRSRDDDENGDENGVNESGDESKDVKKPKVEQRKARPLAEGEEKEERRPKKKVAVLIGYCGTGYRGMQLNPPTKTIEGDLFEAFVKAGAISKANSDDPKKSSLVRCARTDKGVHAAGNVISLKLIVEDEDIVEKINAELVPQIRVWGILQTTGGFSCYNLCDSRMYEYLIPTYCFLPAHPSTFFAQRLKQFAIEENDLEEWEERMKDVAWFWGDVLSKCRKELEEVGYDEEMITNELRLIIEEDGGNDSSSAQFFADKQLKQVKSDSANGDNVEPKVEAITEDVVNTDDIKSSNNEANTEAKQISHDSTMTDIDIQPTDETTDPSTTDATPTTASKIFPQTPQQKARKLIKTIYLREKRAFRIPSSRLTNVRTGFSLYTGTKNFHNFTIQKPANDPSAKRSIRSFTVSDPIIINNTEWLSLKVHGQSFMMHQIRKMVGAVMLIIRSGCPIDRINELYGMEDCPIPKAPSLGLLLDKPLFETYNRKAEGLGREPIDFEPYKDKIQKFRQEFIYDKLFYEEEKSNSFNAFTAFLDNYRTDEFDYLTSKGMKTAGQSTSSRNRNNRQQKQQQIDDDDDDDENRENVDS